jgi:hypothetical protein
MYSLLKYLVGYKTKEQEQSETISQSPEISKQVIKKYTSNSRQGTRNNCATLFLVIEKETQNPLGIFDSLELAKQSGQKITHYNCMIIPFKLNDQCKYLFNPAFEDR